MHQFQVNLKYFSLFLTQLVGAIIQSTLDEDSAKTHSAALSELTAKASHIVGLLNRDDELTFLRIRSKQREIMVGEKCQMQLLLNSLDVLIAITNDFAFVNRRLQVSPDKGFILVVLQNPHMSEE